MTMKRGQAWWGWSSQVAIFAAALVVFVELVRSQGATAMNSKNGYYFNKFRHWPKEDNGTCGDGGTSTVLCPRDYDCYVAPIYNRPFFCWDPRFDPNADPIQEAELARNRTLKQMNESLNPMLDEIQQRFAAISASGINATISDLREQVRDLSEEVRLLREERGMGGHFIIWLSMLLASLLFLAGTILSYLWHRRLYSKRARDTRMLKESIDKLALANYIGVVPNNELVMHRGGLPPRVVDPRPIIYASGAQQRGRSPGTSIRLSPNRSEGFNQLATQLGSALNEYQRRGAAEQQLPPAPLSPSPSATSYLPPPPPPSQLQQQQINHGFPLRHGEERREQSEPVDICTSLRSVYEYDQYRGDEACGSGAGTSNTSFFRRANSMTPSRMSNRPKRQPPPLPANRPITAEMSRRKMFESSDFEQETTNVYNPTVVASGGRAGQSTSKAGTSSHRGGGGSTMV